jgi:hypothetical protein
MATEREILVRLNLRAEQYNQGIRNAERQTDSLKSKVDHLRGAVTRLGGAFATFGAAAVAVATIGELGRKSIQAANELQKLNLQVAAILAANGKITTATGQVLQGIEKIKAAQQLSAGLFRQIQQDALKTTATTKELVEQFAVALPAGMAAGMKPEQVQKLTVAMSNAMKVLSIDAEQAKSEMRALFSGEQIDNSQLAASLGLSAKQIKNLIAQGELYDELTKRLADFNAAAELQSQSLDGVTSSIADMGDKFLAVVGQDALGVLTKGAQELLHEIMGDEKATTSLHGTMMAFAYDARAGMAQLANAVVAVGRACIWVINLIGQADKNLQAWAINAAEKIKQGENAVHRGMIWLRERFPMSPLTRNDLEDAKRWNEERRKAIPIEHERKRQAVEAKYRGIDPDTFLKNLGFGQGGGMRGPKGSGFTYTPNPRALGGSSGRRAGRGRSGSDPAKELERQQEAAVRNVVDEMNHALSKNDAWKGGLAGRIKILNDYLAKLKKMPKAEEEVLDLSRRLELAHIERKVAAMEQEREARERMLEARKEAEREAAEFAIAKAEAQREMNLKVIDWEEEDVKTANERKRAEVQRLYDQQKIDATTYFTEIGRLRRADLDAEVLAAQKRIEQEKQVLELKLQGLKKPKDGLVDWSAVAETEGQLAQLRSESERLKARHKGDAKAIARETGTQMAEAIYDQTRDGLERALDTVFGSGDPIEGIQNAIQTSARKGLIDALAATEVGQKVGGLFGGAGALGGVKGALIGGFLDLIIGSFKDLGRAGEIARAHQDEVAGWNPDPVAQARLWGRQTREKFRKDREKTTKFLGLIPIGYSPGFVTAEEEAAIASEEQRRIAEAEKQAAADAKAQVADTIDGAIARIQRLQKLGRATVSDVIAELNRLQGTAGITQEQLEDLHIQVQELEQQQREDAAAKWDQALSDLLYFGEVSKAEAAKRVEAEMAATDQSTEWGKQRYTDLRKWLKQLNDDMAEGRADAERKAAEEAQHAAQAFEDAWEAATDRSSDFFRRFAEAARNEIAYLKREYDAAFGAIETELHRKVAYGQMGRSEADFEILGQRIEAKQKQINDLLRLDRDDQEVMNRVAMLYSGAFIGGNQWFENRWGTSAQGMSTFLKELQRASQNVGWVSTKLGGQGWQFQSGQLGTLESRWAAANESSAGRQEEIVAIREEIERLKQERDRLWYTVDGSTDEVKRNLENEYRLLLAQYRNDPKAIAEAKKSQIDADFAERLQQLRDGGYLMDRVRPEDRAAISQQLERIRDLMKQQVDAELKQERYTDANPLPVRVVELPPAFPLPASFYFRAMQQPTLRLEEGAIQINESGLSDRQLSVAVEQAIVNAGATLTRVVNRQNGIQAGLVRL